MTTTIAHGISNKMIMQGQLFSSYAASFSSIVAQSLANAPDYVRPLHYVQISQSPSSIDMQTGFLNGFAIPVNIPNTSAWSNMTTAATGASPGSVAALQQAETSALGTMAADGKFSLPQSQQIMAGFSGNFNSYLQVAASGYANSPQFNAIITRYTNVLTQQLALMLTSIITPTASGQSTPISRRSANCRFPLT